MVLRYKNPCRLHSAATRSRPLRHAHDRSPGARAAGHDGVPARGSPGHRGQAQGAPACDGVQ